VFQTNVSQLLKEPVGASRSLEIAGNRNIINGSGIISGLVTLVRTDRGVFVTGHLMVEIEATCCRCLKAFHCPLNVNIEEEYFPTVDVNSGLALKVPDDSDDNFVIDEHHILDLSEAVRQYASLAVPMKPLCHQNCAGIKSKP
jgi:uncharacterized protein